MIQIKKEPKNGFTFYYLDNKEKEITKIIYGDINVTKMIIEECFCNDVYYIQSFALQFPERLKEWITSLFKTAYEYKKEKNILYGSISSHIFSCMNIFSNHLIIKHLHTDARLYWIGIINFIEEWEKTNNCVHKGAAYGWLAMINILIGDIESAFLLLHNAIAEDKKLNDVDQSIQYPETAPSYLTLTLKPSTNNYLDKYVEFIRSFIEKEIENFNNKFNNALDISKFTEIFLDNKNLDKNDKFKEIKFYFVYYVCSIFIYREKFESKKAKSEFSQLNKSGKILGLCILIDTLVKFALGDKSTNKFTKNLIAFYNEEGIPDKDDFPKLICAKAGYEEEETAHNYISQILNSATKYFSNKKCKNVKLNIYSRCFLLLYVLRNFSAHNTKALEIIDEKFDEIISSLFYSIFLVINGKCWLNLNQKRDI